MNPLAKLFIRGHVLLYRLSDGRLGTTMRGSPIVILTTRGAKSGVIRRVPVTTLRDGDKFYVIASLGGAPKNPAWFHNLQANPDVELQVKSDHWRARARVLPEPERSEVWQRVITTLPRSRFATYQQKTTRVIPVVELARV